MKDYDINISFIIYTFHRYYQSEQLKVGNVGEARTVHGGDKKHIQNFSYKTQKQSPLVRIKQIQEG